MDSPFRQKSKWVKITAIWLSAFATSTLIILIFLGVNEIFFQESQKSPRPHFVPKSLEAAYVSFSVQFLNPFYLFSLPSDPEVIRTINNDVVSIDERGFRGAGPEDRGERELAFLIGGSTAFGYFASSNEHTISGYLNRAQSRYFFVNAGVPSWNSTQEVFHLGNELIKYKPKLVIAFDGSNDFTIVQHYYQMGLEMKPGTPESFEYLARHVQNIRADAAAKITDPNLKDLFLAPILRIKKQSELPPLETLMSQAAAKYAQNLLVMKDLCQARGCQLVSIYQPRLAGDGEDYHKFYKAALGQSRDTGLSIHDFSKILSHAERSYFFDWVHLTDSGNQYVADRIVELLGLEGTVADD